MADILSQVAKAPTWQKGVAALAAAYAGWKVADGKMNIAADLKLLPKLKNLKETVEFLKTPGAGLIKQWYLTLDNPGVPQKPMFISADDDRILTFQQVEELSNRVANWALSQGLKPGDVVALMMDNRPEYLPIWLGLAKVRAVGTLINTNTKGKALVHAVTTAGSKVAIFGTEHTDTFGEIVGELRAGGVGSILGYTAGSLTTSGIPNFCDGSFDDALKQASAAPVDKSIWMAVDAGEPCCYIYTSGTTGLPKACKISHVRMMNYGILMKLFDVKPADIVYGSGLPLYHTAANLGTMSALVQGCTVVIRAKFSASQCFADCGKYKATAMQYIGELCRYLLQTPVSPAEKQHNVRIAIGNGLRPEIWNEFQRRFNVPEIGEFYGATEGNAATFNHCQNYEGQGAIGRAGTLFLKARPMNIVKFDVENEVPIRGADGFCIECDYDEPGELIAPIRQIQTAAGVVDDFEGYTSKEATEKKIARDVFAKGDSYFRTGDLIRRDSKGYFYFVDRIGDTFRWKGENISTMEVSEALSAYPGIVDANVYGAEVPGKDGRAGMVALTLEEGATLDPVKFATYCRANLPKYSIPVFIRFLTNVNLTGTFKHQKVEYRTEGCDPAKVKDPMWWYNGATDVFEPYGAEQYDGIKSGRSKL
jgi:acyl-CoA synthetase (AMP-forming)/AMP-acid ligase II